MKHKPPRGSQATLLVSGRGLHLQRRAFNVFLMGSFYSTRAQRQCCEDKNLNEQIVEWLRAWALELDVPGLKSTYCVTLGRFLNLSVLSFPIHKVEYPKIGS